MSLPISGGSAVSWLWDRFRVVRLVRLPISAGTLKTYVNMLRWFKEYLEMLEPVPSFSEIQSNHISGYLASIKSREVAGNSRRIFNV